ncbi:MAG TPA: hypothetical protein VFQ95_00520 [Rhodanobacteraceae bacterium]|nr:hypothetical protein [Rhodanobacteraceae bacterium]
MVWAAARGAHPVIAGSVRVTGWRLADRAANVWVAKVPPGIVATQVYVDGRPAPIDQQPVRALGLDLRHWRIADGFAVSGPTAEFFRGLATGATAAALREVRLVWDPMPPTDWAESECPVAAFTGSRLRMAEPCWNNLTNKSRTVYGGNASNVTPFNLKPGSAPTSIQNTYVPATGAHPPAPGQWYLDRSTARLYYVPAPGQRMAALDVEVPRLQSLMVLAGTLAHPVSNLVFRGLAFQGTTWTQPATDVGFAQVQANLDVTQPALRRHGVLQPATQGECRFAVPVAGSCPWAAFGEPAAAVVLSAARHVVFRDDAFRDLGAIGLKLAYGSSANRIHGNTFTRIASSAIWLGCSADPHPGTPDDRLPAIADACAADPVAAERDDRSLAPDSEIMRGNVVDDNLIHHVGYGYAGAAGITVLFTRHTTIAHNVLFDLPYDAIAFGAWQGHPDVPRSGEPVDRYYATTVNIDADNGIVDNVFHQVMQRYGDGGAIYTEGHQGPTRYRRDGAIDYPASYANGLAVRGNVSDNDSPHQQYFVAPDVGSQWLTVTGNVEWNAPAKGRQYSMSSHWPKAPSAVHTWTQGNWFANPDDTPGSPGLGTNRSIPATPGAADLPFAVLRRAGLQGRYRALVEALPAHVYYVHVADGRVFVAGEGLTRGTTLRLGDEWLPLCPLSPEFAVAALAVAAAAEGSAPGCTPLPQRARR